MILVKRLFPYVATVLLTAAVIYLTPLKWVTIITPTTKDVDPRAFQSEFTKNPDHYLFIDVRSRDAYNKSHPTGAINIPLHDFYDEHYAFPKTGKEIALICGDGKTAGIAYSYLQHYGFFNIERVSGGMINWVAEGLPVASSTSPS